MNGRSAAVSVCLIVPLLSGCSSVGPPTITRDRSDYVSAISNSWKQQMLLNLVKVRYGEAPVFMDVASVIGAYSLEAELKGIGEYAFPGTYISGDRIARIEGTATYTDKPTITYQPLSGEKFARSIMASIPVRGVLHLIESGYPADIVLRATVNTINGLNNRYDGPGNPRNGAPRFRELMVAMREAQAAGDIALRVKTARGAATVVMFVPNGAGANPHVRTIYRLLRLNPAKREFTVAAGSLPDKDTDIAILTRSMLQVITDVASYIDVPPVDLAEGRIYAPVRTAEQQRLFPGLLAVHEGGAPPGDAYAAIHYRGEWFWIDDRDFRSKHMLTFLLLLFSLTEGGPSQPATPLVTIPAR